MSTIPPIIGDLILGRCPVCAIKAKLDESERLPWHTRIKVGTLPRQCEGVGKQAVNVERLKSA